MNFHPTIHMKEEVIIDTFNDQFNSEIGFEASVRYYSDPYGAGTVIEECIVTITDYCMETPEVIRECLQEVIGAHFGKATFEQTIKLEV